MRDVEARHIIALMEFMYAGEVNVAQAHLSSFLKTAESLKIRGLTDTTDNENQKDEGEEEDSLYLNPQPSKHISNNKHKLIKQQISSSSTVTSSQDVSINDDTSSPPPKRQCKTDTETPKRQKDDENLQSDKQSAEVTPKEELAEYLSDEDDREEQTQNFYQPGEISELSGGMEIITQISGTKEESCSPGKS